MTPRVLTATYRLQLTRSFPLEAARAAVPYLHQLGVSHLYLSPILAARTGSTHGYDVVDHARLNPELGNEDDLRALASGLHERDMGIVLDIVPNHMAATWDNPYWRDVLERGRSSRHADWFDIDWDAPRAHGRVVLPVLGDDLARALERDELRIEPLESGVRLTYHDRAFPLDPSTLPSVLQLAQLDPAAREAASAWATGVDGRQRLAELLDAQHYTLVPWRRAPADLNYRRFFDVNDLVALRQETDAVFDATHALVLRWVGEGILDGVRVDHVDGLRNPAWYLARLRREVDARRHPDAPERVPIFVEKILSGDESLPADWPVDGTTGYEFMNEAEEIFLDATGFAAIEANYRGMRRNPSLQFGALAREGKRKVLAGALRPDVLRVARLAHAWRPAIGLDAFARAVIELIVHMDVYRTYLSAPGVVTNADRAVLGRAFDAAREATGVRREALVALRSAFLDAPDPSDSTRTELVMRVQQASGPATAKGVEDTALYAFVPLVSRNEVGGSPERSLDGAARRLHARNGARALESPRTLLAANTHDTKRSADVRARLDVLTRLPDAWARYVARWRRLNRAHKRTVDGRITPDTNTEYLYYQTLLGIWPPPKPRRRVDDLPPAAWRDSARERLVAYMLKAAREAKTWTSWTESDAPYERALDEFVRASMKADEHFLPDVARLTATVADDACAISLSRVVLQCTVPGVPDVYQGDELWSFTLVDPDNRRPVDWDRRATLLHVATADAAAGTLEDEEHVLDDRTKLGVLSTLLKFRRGHPDLFVLGDYAAVETDAGAGLFAFTRARGSERCLVVARTRMPAEGEPPTDAKLRMPADLAGEWTSILTGRTVAISRAGQRSELGVGDALRAFQPCDVLFSPRPDRL